MEFLHLGPYSNPIFAEMTLFLAILQHHYKINLFALSLFFVSNREKIVFKSPPYFISILF